MTQNGRALIISASAALLLCGCMHKEAEPLTENISVFQEAFTKAGNSATLSLQAQMPTHAIANAVRKVTVKASAPVFGGSNEVVVNIANPGVSGNSKMVTVTATLAPGDVYIPAGTELLYQFQVSSSATDKYTAYRKLESAMHISAGQVKYISIVCPDITSYAGLDDDGSAVHPYLIGDRHQMQAMANLMAAGTTTYFKLVDDINLTSISWTSLNPSPFTRKVLLDGNGKTVSHLHNVPLFSDLNGTVTSLTLSDAVITGGEYQGVLAATVKTASSTIQDVTVTGSSVTSTGGYAGGMIGCLTKTCTFVDCAVENTTVSGAGHYAGGLVASMPGGSIQRCHTTGSVTITGAKRHAGGLVGIIEPGSDTEIAHCWSSSDVYAWGFAGGLIGTIQNTHSVTVNRCYASGNVSAGNIAGAGGLIGQTFKPNVTVTNCVAWNPSVTPAKYALGNYSSGAVVGRTHPNCVLTDNYRRRSMNLTAYWVPSSNYNHPNVNGTSAPLVRIGTDKVESHAAATNLTDFDTDHGRWAYHGKRTSSSATAVPDNAFGWAGNVTGSGGTLQTVQLREGVEWTHIQDVWEGAIRNINIVRTTLSNTNRLAMYYDFGHGEDLRDKCNLVGALVATNGPMACCHYVRIDGVTKRVANDQLDYITNCALTIDNNVPDIVRTTSNYDAAALPNQNVGCAGPLLVYEGVIQEYDSTDDFITNTHPRTAFGITEDGNTVIQVAVDGRWAGRAIGMDIHTLAKLMKSLGCYKALNFDGGGGTAMWIEGEGVNGIVNHPTDAPKNWDNPTLRPVGTAVYITR